MYPHQHPDPSTLNPIACHTLHKALPLPPPSPSESICHFKAHAYFDLAADAQEVLTKIRIQKDAEYMDGLHHELRDQQAKTAGLLQTVQDQQKDQVLAEKIFHDWVRVRVLVPKRMALPFAKWNLQRHVNARILVVSSRVTRKLHHMITTPCFIFWTEWTTRKLVCRRLLQRRQHGGRRKLLKRVFRRWEHGMLIVRRAVRWYEGKLALRTLCLKKTAFDTWCEDTYTSIIKARAVHQAFPRGTKISDAFAIEQALAIYAHRSNLLASSPALKMAVQTKSLATIRNLCTVPRQYRVARIKRTNLSPLVKAWANTTRIFAYIRFQVYTMSIQAHAQFMQHVFDAWHLVRVHAQRGWAIASKFSVHRELKLLSLALDDWSLKVQRRLKINRIQTNAILKYFLLRGTVLNLWRKVVQQSVLRQRKLYRMLSRLHTR